MPDYIITPKPETHEFTVREPNNFVYGVKFFPSRCMVCTEFDKRGICRHIEAVERALIDARNAPEREENRLLIETAYIPLKVAHRRRERQKKAIPDAPINDLTKRQDWMD